ncbi:MAG TPA: hypothetical protein VMH05_14365 [Bryobacteraceae bacterium]|nr:hypothetical protein [Bryobacteraceae bacterium]
MLTFSILWVMFAAAITALMLIRRSATQADSAETQARESGNVLAFIAVLSSLLLLAGFLYVGSSLVLSL